MEAYNLLEAAKRERQNEFIRSMKMEGIRERFEIRPIWQEEAEEAA